MAVRPVADDARHHIVGGCPVSVSNSAINAWQSAA